jgi:hypothetical protein
MLVLLAGAAIALEMTVARPVRSEVQRAADAAALAGAAHLIADPDDESGARVTAIEFVQLNPVRGRQLELHPEDVTVDLDSGRVMVRIRAKVLQLPAPLAWLSVSAEATAEGMAASLRPGKPARLRRLRLVDE